MVPYDWIHMQVWCGYLQFANPAAAAAAAGHLLAFNKIT
jgi:hypothetical protein